MTKTDFAELKQVLTGFTESPREQILRDAVIISELIEIIKLQSDALEAQPRYDMSENPPRETYAFKTAQQALSETNTRLQKLRDGK